MLMFMYTSIVENDYNPTVLKEKFELMFNSAINSSSVSSKFEWF